MPVFDTSLILPIAPERWAPPDAPVTVDGVVLAPKPELHITLIGHALGRELRVTFDPGWIDAAVATAFAAQDWHFRRTGRRLRLRKPLPGGQLAHALIEMVELPAMVPFHHALGRLLGRQLPLPPPHVTLYVAGRLQGIGVASRRRLRAFEVGEVPNLFQP